MSTLKPLKYTMKDLVLRLSIFTFLGILLGGTAVWVYDRNRPHRIPPDVATWRVDLDAPNKIAAYENLMRAQQYLRLDNITSGAKNCRYFYFDGNDLANLIAASGSEGVVFQLGHIPRAATTAPAGNYYNDSFIGYVRAASFNEMTLNINFATPAPHFHYSSYDVGCPDRCSPQ
jgi:hypothetical protein